MRFSYLYLKGLSFRIYAEMKLSHFHAEGMGKLHCFLFLFGIYELLVSKKKLIKVVFQKRESFNKILAKGVQQHTKYTPGPSKIFQECKVGFTYENELIY